jgi:hypothetical protein
MDEELLDDEEDEGEVSVVDFTDQVRDCFSELSQALTAALEEDSFSDVAEKVEALQLNLHSVLLWAATVNTEDVIPAVEDAQSILVPWAVEYFDKINTLLSRITEEPELPLSLQKSD